MSSQLPSIYVQLCVVGSTAGKVILSSCLIFSRLSCSILRIIFVPVIKRVTGRIAYYWFKTKRPQSWDRKD